MKLKRYKSIFATLAALALLATACSKIDEDADNICNSATGTTVSVTIPIGIAEQETTAKRVADPPATSRTTAAATAKLTPSPQEGFTVSFGEPAPAPTTTTDAPDANAAPSTRTVAEQLSNVWVLQFDSSGNKVSGTNTGNLAAGAYLTVPTLQVGDGYTIFIIANSYALGLDKYSLSQLENSAGDNTEVADATKLPMSGKLTGVSVVDLGNGTGKISLADATPATVVMRRIHAEVILTVDYGVTGYDFTRASLYNVPASALYGWNDATTTFPDNTTDDRFSYASPTTQGMSSLTPTISGTKTTYQWFIGDNRRGDVAGITAQTDRYSGKAPAYATFARLTLTNSTNSAQKIYYDIYLGSGNVTNFDVKRNHTYTVTAAIKGTASFQEALLETDDARVSSVGIPISFSLTDNRAHSPILVSPKSMESTQTMIWGPEASIPATQNLFDGKSNTDAIMNTSSTAYPAAKYCRAQGAEWYLPAIKQLLLIRVYLRAIPLAERPIVIPPQDKVYFWSSTEFGPITEGARYVSFSNGYIEAAVKNVNFYVRCVKNGAKPTFGSWKYPYVEGNTIVSRDAAGGIKNDALLTPDEKRWLKDTNSPTETYNELSNYNKVSPKFEVASANPTTTAYPWADGFELCKNYSQSGAGAGSWRLPTYQELLLIHVLKEKLTNPLPQNGYFSSTECSYNSSDVGYVSFPSEVSFYRIKTDKSQFRCVRDL